jgi:hypothetical protein
MYLYLKKRMLVMRRKHFVTLSIFLTFSLLLSACTLFGQGTAPTPDPLAQQATLSAAVSLTVQAISANLTSTAAAMPISTFTVAPTLEPTSTTAPVPTATLWIPTATRIVVPATPKPTATATPAAYSCKLNSTAPAADTKIKVNTDFDASWVVMNVGTKVWEVSYVDLKYVSGTKMQTVADIFDVLTAVPMGGKLTLIVDMRAPATAGKYTASWVLTMDGATMCTLPVNIEAVP